MNEILGVSKNEYLRYFNFWKKSWKIHENDLYYVGF